MDDILPAMSLTDADSPWEQRLTFVLDTMREMSRITDPQELVQTYGAHVREVMPIDGLISLSRRELSFPQYKITRSSRWEAGFDPWKNKDRLPIFKAGLLGELIYGDQPVVIDDLNVPENDPAADYFSGMKSLMAIPLFENGRAVNMVVLMSAGRAGFPRERLPVHVWMSNLFGRATQTLVLSNEVKKAYDAVERELSAVADIQRSLLPAELPKIRNLQLAVYYQTSRHSGGDYYDFFKLPNDQWGILIADVSGHGTPAAVLMAITHSIAHMVCDPPVPPGKLLQAINDRLTRTYTFDTGSFVTAFYGVFDPPTRTLTWSNAGHPPPRLRLADGTVQSFPLAPNLPLGIESDETFSEHVTALSPGDTLLFYTDGITEARDRAGNLFDADRLDRALLSDSASADAALRNALSAVDAFSGGQPLADDRTLLAARVS